MPSLLQQLVSNLRRSEGDLLSGAACLSLITPVISRFATDLAHVSSLSSPSEPSPRSPNNEQSKLLSLREDLQYLGYIADRIFGLIILHGDGTLQGAVSLRPFRSLKFLELRRLPLHLLKGLTVLRGQLETIVCVRSLQNLELLLVKCGGDAADAFPWPQLRTLVCVDCELEDLGDALDCATNLSSLDLSRNSIRHSKTALLRLDELINVNLNYNFLEKVPKFSPSANHRLRVLTLRNNRLESLEGLEDLENLQELDISDNCLMSHDTLWPLRRLPRLGKLSLSGNPISFHKKHRVLTVVNLNSQTFKQRRFFLDGLQLTRTEAAYIPDEPIGFGRRSISPVDAEAVSIQTVASSLQNSMQEGSVIDVPTSSGKKKQMRVRVVRLDSSQNNADAADQGQERTNEPPVDILSSSTSSAFAQDIEELREKFGEEWLKFHAVQNSVPQSAPIAIEVPDFTAQLIDEIIHPHDEQLTAEPERIQSAESIDDAPPPLHTESNENESDPFLVQLEDKPNSEDALLVSLGDKHLIERNISGVIVEMLENTSVLKCEISEDDPTRLSMYFDYMRKDRRSRKYCFEDADQALQFLDLVRPLVDEKDVKFLKYQCLQCNKIFPEYQAETKIKYRPQSAVQSGYSSSIGSMSTSNKGILAEMVACPFCSSEMLVEKKSDSSSSDSPEADSHAVDGTASTSPKKIKRSSSVAVLANEPTDDEETILPGSYKTPSMGTLSPPAAERSLENSLYDYGRRDSAEETLFAVHGVDEAMNLLKMDGLAMEAPGFEWSYDDYTAVDHRLRLHVDMNLLTEPDEQFQMIVKVDVFTMEGTSPREMVWVVSNLNVLICTLSEDSSVDPSEWLRPQQSISLRTFNLLHTVCDNQCLRLGLTDGSFLLLLFRDESRAQKFAQQFQEVLANSKVPFYLRESSDVSTVDSWLAAIPFEDEDTEVCLSVTCRRLCYMGKSPVSLICTESHLIIATDDYSNLVRSGSTLFTLVDAKPLSSISNLVMHASSPTVLGIKFFNEDIDAINQWDFHFEALDGLEKIVQSIRSPWENVVFHVPLNVELHP
ncbi:serine/threonine-protein kinase 11-interacting protein-like [Paramacrobiotus metropolitanus]|uniref:serine/threonine-protein kinase 11-interacting protein-like n=1 Tax=Paramacrobiotus metropolitanus TaxID=2943436 RepID=UPI002445FFD9|nr:serine/threonine-protein kinase 11-interacting protein-like [Paramacrobiotus metropolitanus]